MLTVAIVMQSQCLCVCERCHRACGRNPTFLTTCRQLLSTLSYRHWSLVKAMTLQVI